MSSATARGDRRRRMLNAGANSEASTTPGDDRPAGVTRRYAPDEASVSFGLARRVLPTGAWSLAGVALGSIAIVAGLVAGDVYQASLANYLGASAQPLFDFSHPMSLAGWCISAVALSIMGLCGVLFGMRRQRSDDMKGVYRWWMTGVLATAAVSLCLATGLHQVIATALAAKVGWSPLAGDAFWWLAPALLGPGLVAIRLFFDLKESRLAAFAGAVAIVAGSIAVAASIGWLPASLAPNTTTIEVAALLVALVATGVSLLGYIRRIVIEADGKIAAPIRHKPAVKQKREEAAPEVKLAATTKSQPDEPKTTKSTAKQRREQRRKAKPDASQTQWVDGSQGAVDDDYGDEDAGRPRKLTKAERKRLRKLKERQNRAA